MILEHVAIWTSNLELLKDFYATYFNGIPNEKYTNEHRQFSSYFISFASGARLELMTIPNISAIDNNTANIQRPGIAHLAFGVDSPQDVDEKAAQLAADGFPILSGPRKTGDGYYEFETLDPDNNRLEITARYFI